MAQYLSVFTILVEDMNFIPSTNTVVHNYVYLHPVIGDLMALLPSMDTKHKRK